MWGALLVSAMTVSAAEVREGDTSHEQSGKIEIRGDDGEQIALHAYCLGPAGEVLAGVGGQTTMRVATANGFKMEEVGSPTEIRVYDPETSELMETWELPIVPEAMCTGPDGKVYVAGEGTILVLDELGEEVARAQSPHARLLLEDDEALRVAAKEELEANRGQFDEQIAEFEKMLEQFEGRDDLTPAEQSSKQMAEMNLQAFQQFAEQWNVSVDDHMESMRQSKMKFSSISVGENVIFATVPGLKGYGFEVWRIAKDLSDGSRIVADLSGCCGQMEARAHGDELFVAENGRHRVVHFDKEGVLQSMWGERSEREGGGAGFGSCCNPMNLAFEPGGDVFAAEAEGHIKRYTAEGSYQGTVAHCELPPGCKNVAIRLDNERDRLYMIDIVRGNILVFEPRAKASRTREL